MEIIGIFCLLPLMPLICIMALILLSHSLVSLFKSERNRYIEEVEFDGKFKRRVEVDRDYLPQLPEKDIWRCE